MSSTAATSVESVEPAPRPPEGEELARLLLQENLIDQRQFDHARRIRSKLSTKPPLLSVLRELGYIEEQQLRETLRKHRVSIRLGALLVELGHLKEDDLRHALGIQADMPKTNDGHGRKLGDILVDNHLIQEQKLLEVLADQLGFRLLTPVFAELDKALLRKVTPGWYKQRQLIPVAVEAGQTVIAFADPLDQAAQQEANKLFGPNIILGIASKRAIAEAIAAYERSLNRVSTAVNRSETENATVTLVNAMIVEAIVAGASDIHIEPMKDRLRVRFRCDGVLVPFKEYSVEQTPAMISRIKVMAGADIAEKRRHQDGRIMFEDAKTGHALDLRASFYATIYGEKVVLRLLTKKAELIDLDQLGLAPKVLDRFYHDVLDVPSGVVLITGPTGSGKTTTLYSCVNFLNDVDCSIITAEDPVEYVIEGVGQCSLNPKIGLTYENTLPSIVRQDPDVIVLGEIRDQFSAEAAIQAALTGHKVLTTFHTEDTIGGLLRLMNMNIETFLISSTVVSVLAQRLLRRVCQHCAEPYRPTPLDLRRLGCSLNDLLGADFRLGRGCRHCRHTGYRGRVGVFELLILNEQVKDAILNKKTSYDIRRVSVETSGLVSLLEDGVLKAARGETSVAEVLRHLPRLDQPRPLAELKRLTGV